MVYFKDDTYGVNMVLSLDEGTFTDANNRKPAIAGDTNGK